MADVRDEVTGPARWRGIGFSSAVKTASVSREHLNHLNHVDSDRPFCSSIALQTPYKMTTTDTILPPTDAQPHPHEISFPLPKALHTTAHIHLTRLDTCTTVFLATSTPGDSGGTMKPMGSFVYAMPDVSRIRRRRWLVYPQSDSYNQIIRPETSILSSHS